MVKLKVNIKNLKTLAIAMAEQNNDFDVEKCETAIQIILKKISNGIAKGDKTDIRQFGTITPVVYEPALRRNPATGDFVAKGYTVKAHFRPATKLKNMVA